MQKKKVFGIFFDLIGDDSHMTLLDGTNVDDIGTDRPGHKAIKELKVITPLVLAGFGKGDIRNIAQHLELPNWNRESASCLATRVQHGSNITISKLNIITACEEVISRLGFAGCRARLSDDQKSLIIEVNESDIELVSGRECRTKLVSGLSAFGIEKIHLDLAGR